MKALSTAIVAAISLCSSAGAVVRCIATCEYYASAYNTADSGFIELSDISIDNGESCSTLMKAAKYRVPVTSSGATETEAKAALQGECQEATAYVERLYKAKIYLPRIFEVHYCG